MNSHHFKVALLVVILTTALLTASRGLSGKLPHLFPHLAREAPPVEVVAPEPIRGKALASPRFSKRLAPLTTPVQLPPLSHDGFSASFTIPPALEPIVDFWRKVYGVYDTKHVIIHDMEELGIQYSVLDFTSLSQRNISDAEKRSIREAEVNREIKRIRGILRELSEGASQLSPDAVRIARLFQVNDPDQFKRSIERVRSQTGLRDRYLEGLQRSGRYMPFFEAIFHSYDIPREISRLVFVESLFKERAYSKVGAAGLWQFMPSSAQHYMEVGHLLDERYDPIVATHGAARLLLKNYELLGTWPLAINAYNSGAGNLMRAVSQLGTRDIATIVTRFKSGSYAFASRNFYPSFLAALSIYENREKYFGHVNMEPLMQFEVIQLPASMGFPEIAYLSQSALPELKELNPSFANEVFDGDYVIPAGAQIRIPDGTREQFSARFVQYYSGSEPPALHIVRANEGESLDEGRVLLVPTATSIVRN